MRVPDVVLKSVGFVGQLLHEDANGMDVDWQGTGFFVRVPGQLVPSVGFLAFVTAKHVAEKLQGKDICFAINKKTGGITTLPNPHSDWWVHPSDQTADVKD
jgi:hypothetical protein